MRNLSFCVLVFAAVIVFTSALPLDNGNDSKGYSTGLRAVEKNRLSKKPPGKPPGPKLVQEPHVTAGVKIQESGNNPIGSVALEDANNKVLILLSEDKKGKKHDLAFLNNDHKKDDKKKD